MTAGHPTTQTARKSLSVESGAVYGVSESGRRLVVTFGKRVRAARKGREMSQEALATALSAATSRSYHQTTVARMENGTRPTSVGEAYLVAMLLGVAVTDLLDVDA